MLWMNMCSEQTQTEYGYLENLQQSSIRSPSKKPVAILASYVPHTQMPVWSNTSVVVHNLYFVQVTIMGQTSGQNLKG